MKSRDAYLFMNDQKETLVFVYIKMTKEQLQQSLKDTYIDYNNNDEVHKKKNYLCVFIDKNDCDYLAQNSQENIEKVIIDAKMVNLFTNSYNEIKNTFLDYTEEQFESNKKFVLEQFDSIEEFGEY